MVNLISLFSGCGGLDLGFERLGFDIIWANDFDRACLKTYRKNHTKTFLDERNITKILSEEIPDADGIIGGPPCQSWSSAGSNKGADDPRGQVFFEYLRIINDKNPKFFVIENVEGILRSTHSVTLDHIITLLSKCGKHGYNIRYKLLNAKNYGVPQDRKRVFFVGIRKDFEEANEFFEFPEEHDEILTLKDAIYDLRDKAKPHTQAPNEAENFDHYYLDSGWSSQFMTRNRVRTWNQCGFTVPASGRHVTMHPQAPVMKKENRDSFVFVTGKEDLYRRFTIRECARIQTFPDNFKFAVRTINDGYKLIGNAVPPKLAEEVATSIAKILEKLK